MSRLALGDFRHSLDVFLLFFELGFGISTLFFFCLFSPLRVFPYLFRDSPLKQGAYLGVFVVFILAGAVYENIQHGSCAVSIVVRIPHDLLKLFLHFWTGIEEK